MGLNLDNLPPGESIGVRAYVRRIGKDRAEIYVDDSFLQFLLAMDQINKAWELYEEHADEGGFPATITNVGERDNPNFKVQLG